MIRKICVSKFSKYNKAREERKMYEGSIKTALRSIYIKIIPGWIFIMIQIFFKYFNFCSCKMSFTLQQLCRYDF